MKKNILFSMIGMILLGGCFHSPKNELESMTETVIKKHEGVDIKVMPVDVPKEK